MEESSFARKTNKRKQPEEIVLHFINGRLQLGEKTIVCSNIQNCFVTIYSDEIIGQIVGSDVVLGYNEGQQVWVSVKNCDGMCFVWGNWETERKVSILFYLLTYDGEYLMFCNNKDFFCYHAVPQKDPRQNLDRRVPNTHMIATYHVLNDLLGQTNVYSLKVLPT